MMEKTDSIKELKNLFAEKFLSCDKDIYMFLNSFENLDTLLKGNHNKIIDFCKRNKIYICLKNAEKYEEIKNNFRENIYNASKNIYLRKLENYFENLEKYNIKPIQNLCHNNSPQISSENGSWISSNYEYGENYKWYEGLYTDDKELSKEALNNAKSYVRICKSINENFVEEIDYIKKENKEFFENSGCLIYFIPIILISLMFMIL